MSVVVIKVFNASQELCAFIPEKKGKIETWSQ